MPLHWLWAERALQLRGDDTAGKEPGRVTTRTTPRMLYPEHYPETGQTDSVSYQLHTLSGLST